MESAAEFGARAGAGTWPSGPRPIRSPSLPSPRPGSLQPAAALRPDPRAPATGAPVLPEDIGFLIFHGIDFGRLAQATARARRLGVAPLDCLIASGICDESTYLDRLGRHLDAPVLRDARIDPRVCADDAIGQGWCRAFDAAGAPILLFTPRAPLVKALLALPARRRQGHLGLVSEATFRALILRHFSAEIAAAAVTTVPEAESARTGATSRQIAATAVILLLFILGCLTAPDLVRTLLPLAFGLFFIGAGVVTLSACIEGAPVAPRHSEADDAKLPMYSIIVPLYREPEVAGQIVAALSDLDYPAEKLQILFAVEEDDAVTRAAFAGIALPAHMAVLPVPDGQPRTKPRAINAAMRFVTGDCVVVYDAEDRPEPGQLRAAAAAFARAGKDVVCLQARLAIDNTGDSLLTALFTIEYAALFDVVKAGNARMGLPVPLGGTSNHFRTAALREIGLWDAWNVTEDADLGLRLAMHGVYVDDLPSTTDEEAPNRFRPWLHQRRRWLKGWMQTIVTHSRAPLATIRAMGPVNFLAAVSMSAGIVIGALGAPFFYLLLALRLASDTALGAGTQLDRTADGIILVLGVTGIAAMLLPAIIGLWRRGLMRLMPLIALLPLYQLLVSLAAWLALYDLMRAPHAWNKTTHGQARTSRRGAAAQKQ